MSEPLNSNDSSGGPGDSRYRECRNAAVQGAYSVLGKMADGEDVAQQVMIEVANGHNGVLCVIPERHPEPAKMRLK